MATDLRLQVVLQTIDKATAVLKKIEGGSSGAAKALRDTRARLKDLDQQQRDVGRFRDLRTGLEEANAKLKAAQDRVRGLAQGLHAAGPPSQKMIGQLKQAKIAAQALAQQQDRQQQQVQALREKLAKAGISTANLAEHERRLRAEMVSTTAAVTAQTEKLKAQAAQHKRLAELKQAHARQMMHVGMTAAAGVGALGAGRAMTRPLSAMVNAFAPNEDAATQLRASMMRSDGSVPADFQKITDLATRLGDKLPGTTADFQNMMTMLVRQGMSAKTILGGLGESAAYLGVQLRMPVIEAAEFAAKMQDATRTTEADMMGLMDVIQRTYYLGVDSGNMLQGFTKMSPVLGILRKEGLGAAKDLAPLLVLMDQAGMAGESAGNAIRKVFQGGLDAKKVGKGNALLAGTGLQLNFTDAKGNFAGLDNLFQQLDKLKSITSDTKRFSVMKEVFGDDAETLQVLNTLMAKGKAGYQEVVDKMQAQADLRRRVDQQLETLTNQLEATQGNFSNMLADIGATAAPALKDLLQTLAGMASSVGAWARENPALVGSLVKMLAILAILAGVLGTIAIGAAAVMGPMFLLRFGMGMLGVKGITLVGVLGRLFGAFRALGAFMLANPIVLALTLMAVAAYMLWSRWDQIKGGLQAIWQDLGGSIPAVLATITAAIVDWSPLGLFYQAFAGVLSWFGIQLPAKFSDFGLQTIQGLANGITGALGWLKDAVDGAATAAIGWFKDKLGIKSPSRVFMVAGGHVAAGAALGITGGYSRVRRAAAALATAAAVAAPSLATAAPLRFDTRAPLTAAAAAPTWAPAPVNHYEIHLHAAPGMDERALLNMLRAELDRREAANRARLRSTLGDTD